VLIDVKMAWRNIWRNPRRTVLTVLAIAFACVLLVFMLSFQFGSYDTMINASVKINTGHLQIQAPGYQARKKMELVISDPAPVERMLDKMPSLSAYTCRARGFALVSTEKRSYGAVVVGVEPDREAKVSTLSHIVQKGKYWHMPLTPKEANGALLGRLLARNLDAKVGDDITILGQGRDGSVAATVLTVQGIYSSGIDEFDRSAVQIPLSTFQQVFDMGKAVHEVVVIADHLSSVPALKADIRRHLAGLPEPQKLTVLDWDQLMPGLRQAIQMDLVSGGIFYMILIMVVAFSILNTFLMAILERTHEFGVMMAVGTRPGRLTRLVLTESAGMTLVGVAAGVLMGCLLTWYFQVHGIEIAGSSELFKQYGIPPRLFPRLTPLSASIGPAVVFVITFLSALYPALKVRRLKPVDAMNQ
jgi:ABC-type lipoprotein release transport system permease subunit